MSNSLRIDAASHMRVVDAIQLAAEILGMQEGLDPDASHFFSLALREAVVNAINHGHGGDPSRRVKVDLQTNGRGNLVFTVKDQGPGFEPSELADPRAPANLDRGSGRGVFYMRQFSDRVDFSFPDEGGTVVRLEKQVPSDADRKAREGNSQPLYARQQQDQGDWQQSTEEQGVAVSVDAEDGQIP